MSSIQSIYSVSPFLLGCVVLALIVATFFVIHASRSVERIAKERNEKLNLENKMDNNNKEK